ncbi:hypothetical protein R50072_02980 [Simiduia litorea]|uniref:hypothetical protein n=1 Tax=Simiduia litorea TaxID=1435348 RepID=UPI0036F25B6E
MKIKNITWAFTIAAFSMAAQISAANETSPRSKILRITSYAKFGNGDVYVKLEESSTVCAHGYFLNRDSVGFETSISMLISAYHAGSSVLIVGDEQRMWSGSSNPVCEIYSIQYQ